MTDMAPPAPTVPPNEAYGIFCGAIDATALQRIFQSVGLAMQGGVTKLDVLFQSHGGFVGDGVCLYNLFHGLPLDLTLYNVGSVFSIGTIAFLGAKRRKASAHASFMIHRTFLTTPATTAGSLKAGTQVLSIDDARTEAILRRHLNMTEERWGELDHHDLYFSAEEAVEVGIATEIGEFAPPPGQTVFNL